LYAKILSASSVLSGTICPVCLSVSSTSDIASRLCDSRLFVCVCLVLSTLLPDTCRLLQMMRGMKHR
jgi:hypothetical protein